MTGGSVVAVLQPATVGRGEGRAALGDADPCGVGGGRGGRALKQPDYGLSVWGCGGGARRYAGCGAGGPGWPPGHVLSKTISINSTMDFIDSMDFEGAYRPSPPHHSPFIHEIHVIHGPKKRAGGGATPIFGVSVWGGGEEGGALGDANACGWAGCVGSRGSGAEAGRLRRGGAGAGKGGARFQRAGSGCVHAGSVSPFFSRAQDARASFGFALIIPRG